MSKKLTYRHRLALPLCWLAMACSAEPGTTPTESEGVVQAAVRKEQKPITDTHIHFWDVSRPIPWPDASYGDLYQTFLPSDYQKVARANNIVGVNVVEASNVPGDNQWVLGITAGKELFRSFAANLEIGSPTFASDLDALAQDDRVVGIRGFLQAPTLDPDNQAQIADCQRLAARGMTLDIISRFSLNPEDRVAKLAEKVPRLRIIIDHLGGARPDMPGWEAKMHHLASYPNIYLKFSSFFDIFNPSPTGDESVPWHAPTDVAPYKPYFDVLMNTFDPDRLIWGSNWPVVQQGGSIESEIAIAEGYLAPFGNSVRNKVMHTNAKQFYKRAECH